jgi:asparagine synthase (glutamine-hydrolysing)
MQRYADRPINTYSIGFDRQAGVPDETDVARRTAEAIGTRHHTITVDDAYVERIFDSFIRSIDQPSIDGINTYMVSGETAREMKVALSGLGGDEIFAGYPHFNLIRQSCRRGKGVFSRLGAAIHARRPNRFTRPLAFAGLREEEAIDEQRRIHKDLTAVLSRPSERKAPPVYQGLSPLQKISKAELDRYLLSTLLRDGDSLSMAHALELRPVLLDHELVELAFGLSDSFKIRDGQLKSIFIDSVRDLIPEEVWQRRKTGFDMPYPRWMNGRLNEKFKELLRQPQAQQLFTAEYLRSLEDRVAQRKTKRADWMALVFLSWIEQYGVAV